MQPDWSSFRVLLRDCRRSRAAQTIQARARFGRGRRFAQRPQGVTKRKEDAEVVLIVDDDPDIREAIRTLLEEEGYPTAEACNGQEALALIQQPDFKAGLILLDLMMPTMNSLRASRATACRPSVGCDPGRRYERPRGNVAGSRALGTARPRLRKPPKISISCLSS